MLAQKAHTVGRQAQQPQLVGNSGLGFPQPFRRLLLRKAVGRDQPRDGRSLFQVVQIAALEVFDQREQRALLLARAREQARHLAQPRELCRAQPSLPRDELIALVRAADSQRLEDAIAADAVAQRAQRGLVKLDARLVGVGAQRIDGQIEHAAREQRLSCGHFHGFPLLFLHF